MALAAAASDRNMVMERCAEAVVAARHPGGMVDVTGVGFEWLSISGKGDTQVVIGSIVEPEGGARVARRFVCRMRAMRSPRITFVKTIRL
ncbi:MAG: hypothetical protein E7773_12990 [Sphingomonas sp.]|uniref:hypothetical protein n=1 Tax=Sphingomonas sp. TaxID=28214 RepID=UPI0012275878|nr:hypothetical protein [Sphingomonas sp.]THD35347.1 MAG: hypothetical protein E7773_12990 [Sphingomonas sp.]